MPPATGPALIILVAFVLPGFVTVLLQERTFKRAEDPTALDRLLRILYYSVWTYLLLALVALIFGVDRPKIEHLYDSYQNNPAQLVWRAALVVVVPSFVIATATRLWWQSRPQRKILDWARINERHEEPTAWDFFFRQRAGVYVRVTFDGGGRVLGYYGPDSFAAYAKDGRDLFLERVYAADSDDWFGAEAAGTCGVWVKGDNAVCVEFYNPDDAATTETRSEDPEEERPPGAEAATAGSATPAASEER